MTPFEKTNGFFLTSWMIIGLFFFSLSNIIPDPDVSADFVSGFAFGMVIPSIISFATLYLIFPSLSKKKVYQIPIPMDNVQTFTDLESVKDTKDAI